MGKLIKYIVLLISTIKRYFPEPQAGECETISVIATNYDATTPSFNKQTDTAGIVELTLTVPEAISAPVTMTIAVPGVTTWAAHGFANGQTVVLSTTGALPTGLTIGTTYYLVNVAANTFELAATLGGASINTTGTQSGIHTATVKSNCGGLRVCFDASSNIVAEAWLEDATTDAAVQYRVVMPGTTRTFHFSTPITRWDMLAMGAATIVYQEIAR